MSTTADTLADALRETSIDEVTARHRREKKDLQARIQELKKNAPKNDKKKRKEAMEEVMRMEQDLHIRQQQELTLANQILRENTKILALDEDELTNDKPTSNSENDEKSTPRISKAQKRRDKKANEARIRKEEIIAASKEAVNAPKAVEQRKLDAKLKEMLLMIYEVPSDGDCLYNAVRHQLGQHDLSGYTVDELREETANYIRANKSSLICYMTDPYTGNPLDDEQFEHYCNSVQSTPAWGGQIELKALSTVLEVPIEVIQAEGPTTIQGATEFKGPKLTITYHRHMYSLGEHYNSTMPLCKEKWDDME